MPQKDIRKIASVRTFLLDISIFERLEVIQEKFKLPPERQEELLTLADAVIKGELEIQAIPSIIATAFGLDEAKAKLVSADVAGYRLLPLEAYFPGIADQIKSWGGKIQDYPAMRVKREQSQESEEVEKFAEKIGLELPVHLMKRFAYLSKGYLTKERAKDATIQLVKRPITIGGLGLTDEQADKLLTMLEAELGDKIKAKVGKSESDNKVVILSEGIPLSRRISSPSQKSESQGSENKEVIQNAEEVNSDGVEVREIAKEVKPEGDEPKYLSKDDLRKLLDEFKDDTPPLKSEARESDNKVVILSEGIPLSRRISSPSQEAENLKSVSKPKPLPKPKAYPPLRAVVETSHLKGEEAIEHVIEIKPRDPKNSLPAKSVTHALAATVPVISGSMLSDSEKAEAMHHENALKKSDVIDNAEFKKRLEEKVNKALGPVIEVFKKKRIAKKVFAEVARAHVRGVREPLRTEQLLRDKHGISGADLDTVMLALESARKIHEEGYRKEQEVRGKSSNIQDDSETSAQSVQAREMDLLNNRHAVTTGKTLDKLTDTPAPNAQVSAARTKLEELQAQEGKIDQEKLRKAKNLPTKARAKLTVQSAPPQAVGIIQDVKFVPKLMGPVEVLGAMTPEEFRRFASDPVESAQKIKDKIALLEASAYEERVRGIKAWRNSPINKLYLVMSNEALTGGVTIAEIATKRRNSGDESLSPAEISALISLNSSLKF